MCRLTTRQCRALLVSVALACGLCRSASSQGQSLAAPFPALTAHAPTGLQLDYATGKIVAGGLLVNITGNNLTVADAQTNCQAPAYAACNLVYWPGTGNSLLSTTVPATAWASGNVVVGYVTATGGNIAAITPISIALPTPGALAGFWVAPGDCQQLVSGGSTGTNGQTTAGASSTPVIQSDSDNSGTYTHTYKCNISPLVRPSYVVDATIYYGVQTTALGTQVAVLASGTMNGSIVFSSITYPSPAASETPSTVTPVRADSGTLTITPVVGSFNTTTTTAGAFYSAKFVPAAPIYVSADHVQLLLTVTLSTQASSATITNVPGVYVRYTR